MEIFVGLANLIYNRRETAMAANEGRIAPTAIMDRGETGEKFGIGVAMFKKYDRIAEGVERTKKVVDVEARTESQGFGKICKRKTIEGTPISFIRQDGAGVCCRSDTSMHLSNDIVRHEMASQGCYHELRISSCIPLQHRTLRLPRNQ
jgi:hypothetical protein